jgi:hypothetical protein
MVGAGPEPAVETVTLLAVLVAWLPEVSVARAVRA